MPIMIDKYATLINAARLRALDDKALSSDYAILEMADEIVHLRRVVAWWQAVCARACQGSEDVDVDLK